MVVKICHLSEFLSFVMGLYLFPFLTWMRAWGLGISAASCHSALVLVFFNVRGRLASHLADIYYVLAVILCQVVQIGEEDTNTAFKELVTELMSHQ